MSRSHAMDNSLLRIKKYVRIFYLYVCAFVHSVIFINLMRIWRQHSYVGVLEYSDFMHFISLTIIINVLSGKHILRRWHPFQLASNKTLKYEKKNISLWWTLQWPRQTTAKIQRKFWLWQGRGAKSLGRYSPRNLRNNLHIFVRT